MNVAFVVVRAVHLGAAIALFGEFVFVSVVASAAWSRDVASTPGRRGNLERHVNVVTPWALVVSAASGAAWLAFEAASMGGTTLARALLDGTAALVLRATAFGHVWVLRTVLLVLLAATLPWLRRAPGDAARQRRAIGALSVAALYLATLAFAGHATAVTEGGLRALHLGADVLHLLAAGAWLGALPALVYCLRNAPSNHALARVTSRFSVLGIACVAILLASGIVNALFLVGSFAALFGTPYGQLLVVKLAVFAAMLGIAAINRWRLTPQLANDDRARGTLRRNAMLEIGAGVVVIAIVGALGAMVPGAHRSPVWPFAFRLDFAPANVSRGVVDALLASAAVALAGLALMIYGMHRRAARLWLPGCVALLVAAAASTLAVAVPAFPTTYATSPVAYSVDAVARGAALYAANCSRCHGADGRGDGPAAASLSKKPINVAEHALHHPPGNLFWWIAHGIPQTAMPAFAPRLSDTDIWELVQFLVARSSAEAALSLRADVGANSMSRAPDFTYEVPQQGQQALSAPAAPALIVLYSLPQSQRRLAELAADHRVMHGGVRVIAIPLTASGGTDSANALTQTVVNADVTSVYAMFARTERDAGPVHTELLVDGAGVLRARWTGLPSADADRDAEIIGAVQHLPKAPRQMHHGH
jgi:putative copper export protein/mono/diheme cytochrome c family protein